MFCNKCGEKLSDDAKFCTKCGTKTENKSEDIATTAEQTNMNSNKNKNSKKVILAIAIPIAIVVFLMLATFIGIKTVTDNIFKNQYVSKELTNSLNKELEENDTTIENKVEENIINEENVINEGNIVNEENVDNISNEELKKIYSKYFTDNYDKVYKVLTVDLTNDGKDEMIVIEEDKAGGYTLKVFNYNNQKVNNIYQNKGTKYHASGFIDMYLYQENGKNYLLNAKDAMWQGRGSLEYEIFSLTNFGNKLTLKTDKVQGDPVKDSEYNAYYKRYSEYAKKSIELIVTSGPKGIDKSSEYTPNSVFGSKTETSSKKPTSNPTETKKENNVKNSTLKYGTYKGQFDTSDLYATIVINQDGTASYVGNVDQHGNTKKKINVTGTWKTRENVKSMQGPNVSYVNFIDFSWSNGTKEGYWLYDNSFGDQWHTFIYSK